MIGTNHSSLAHSQTAAPVGQAVQITTLLGDSVVSTHRLDGEACGRVRPATRTLLVVAASLCLAGVVMALQAALGAAAGLLLLGTALGVLAATRAARERRAPHFLVGEGRDAQLPLSGELLPAPCYPLVLSTPGGYHLLFGSGMEGIVEENGQQRSLDALLAAGQAWPVSGMPARAVPLPPRGRAWLRIGEATVTVETMEPSPALRAPLFAGRGSSGLLSNVASFSAHATLLMLVFALPPAGATLSLDSFNVDSRTIRYAIHPTEPKDSSAVPWFLRKAAQQPGGGGPAAKNEPGKLGNPKARPLRGRLAVIGHTPNLQAAKEWARQAARTSGILGLMGSRRGGPFAHLLSTEDHALGPDALEAMGGLVGNIVGEDSGTGGLTAYGNKHGGGGDASDIIPGTGIGLIPDGRGPGGYGRCVGRLCGLGGAHKVKAPPPRPEIKVTGGLDKELIRREIKKHLNEIKFCYSKELQGKPELEGRVVVNFTIAPSGRVVSSQIQHTTLGDREVEGCITQAFFRWSFPRPPDQNMVMVLYPFIFHPTER